MHRYLDPSDTLGEIMFGLIMTLTFTLGAGIIIEDEGREGARELLVALIGCNIAWGLLAGAGVPRGPSLDPGPPPPPGTRTPQGPARRRRDAGGRRARRPARGRH